MDSTTSSASIPIIPGAVAATTCTGLGTSPPVTSSGAVTATEAPTPTVGAVASATVSMIPNTSTITNPSTGTTGCTITTAEMETKCTQTKLDDELEPPLILQTTSSTTSESIIKPSTITPVTASGVEPNCGSRSGSISVVGPPKSGSITNEAGVPIAATNVTTEPVVTNEGAGSNPVTADTDGTSENPIPGAAAAQATATSTESKGEIGTWTSSTEVCPWEDEENRRESHAPFVKTYATLGYL